MKDTNHTIVSINTKKIFEKVYYPFMIKILNMVIEGMYLNITKSIYDRPTGNIIPNGEKLKTSSKIRNETSVPTCTNYLHHRIGILVTAIREEKHKKHPN